MERKLTERCSEDKALGCYLQGLSLATEAATAGERHDAVSLISEACAARVETACETLNKRLKLPRRTDGRAVRYTPQALELRLEGKFVVRCTLPETGLLEGCQVEPPTSEEERRRFAASKIEQELLAAFDTWRFTPALLDDRPFPFDCVFRMKFVLPQPAPPDGRTRQWR